MRRHRRRKLQRYWLILLLVIAAAAAAIFLWPNNNLVNVDTTRESSPSSAQPKIDQPPPPFINLQPTVNAWAAQQGGRASVVVYDLANRKTVASLNPSRQYFAASIYKLYVAYVGYQKVADGTYKFSEPYLREWTRGKCLDEMIRSSNIPCGEKMWNELGKENLTEKLKTYGLTNTSMTALSTSAGDAAIVLQRLFEKKDLTSQHRKLLMDSLKEQPAKYRRGLPSGFNQATVYNKVGWNLLVEWHDAAIVTLPNGRSYIISAFTQNVGSSQIAALGRAIEARLTL